MTSFLLLTAIVIFACVFLNRVSDKIGIPVLLAFILLGMFFGSDGPINIAFENLLDSFFKETAWDVSTDISVLKTMLAQEGLTGGKDFQEKE